MKLNSTGIGLTASSRSIFPYAGTDRSVRLGGNVVISNQRLRRYLAGAICFRLFARFDFSDWNESFLRQFAIQDDWQMADLEPSKFDGNLMN